VTNSSSERAFVSLQRVVRHLQQHTRKQGHRPAESLQVPSEQLEDALAELLRARDALRDALQESRQRDAEATALLESARAVLEYHEFGDAARTIFHCCKKLIGAAAGYVALLDPDGTNNEIVYLDAGGLPCAVDPTLPMPIRGLRAEAYRTGRAVYDNSFPDSEWARLIPPQHAPLQNVLFAPLTIKGKAVGLLGVANKPGGFTEHDARMASAFGEFASVALHNSRTLESLETSEKRFRSVVETAGDAIVSVDRRGDVVFWNDAAEETFGYAAGELLGKPLVTVIPERFREAHRERMQRLVSGRAGRIIGRPEETVGLRKSGAEFPMELSVAAWQVGNEPFLTGIIRDISRRKRADAALRKARDELETRVAERTAELTLANLQLRNENTERRRAEAALRESRAFLQTVIDGMPEPVLVIDRDHRVVLANQALRDDYPGKDPVADRLACYQVSHHRNAPCGAPEHVCPLPDVVATGAPVTVTHTHCNADGNEAVVEVIAAPIFDKKGRVVQMIESCHDITARVRAEEQARQRQAELAHVARLGIMAEMATGLAHELNQPLSAIVAYIHACLLRIRSGAADPAELLDNMERAAAQAQRAGDIVDRIRDFTCKGEARRTEVNINTLVREAADLAKPEARRCGVRVHLDLDELLAPVVADSVQIEQVIVNLLRNALEAMSENGNDDRTLTIRTSMLGTESVQLAVRDTGPGLADEHAERVFTRFFTTKADGMGMGLSISRSIIDTHGGRLWMTPNPDRGVTFQFTLPAAPGDLQDDN